MRKVFDDYKELVFIVLASLFVLWAVRFGWGAFHFPSAAELVQIVVDLFNEYGLIIVFFAAVIESLLLIGGYFPGTLIIFLSLSLVGGDLQKTALTVLTATAGMLVGYSFDYFLGKGGVTRILKKLQMEKEVHKLQREIERQGVRAGFFLYILPGFGALISTTFGIIKYDFKKFFVFMLLTVLAWNSLWGLTGYLFGGSMMKVIESGYFGIIILGIFIIYFVASGRYAEFKKALNEAG
jgi:membrane protein DedA with SNARE-associated domain